MEYKIITFDNIPEDEYVDIEVLKKFIEDAEMIISSFGYACTKDHISSVIDSGRGAGLLLNDGLTIYGYNIYGKLIKDRSKMDAYSTMDLLKFCRDSYRNNMIDTFHQIIKLCRHHQKEYIEKDGKISGTELLNDLLLNGYLKPGIYFAILLAVSNYKDDYTLITDDLDI